MEVLGYDIGTFTFFTFSFIAALIIFLPAIFGCKEETTMHRWVRGFLGLAYLAVAIVAFVELTGHLESTGSPYQQLLPFAMMLVGRSTAARDDH